MPIQYHTMLFKIKYFLLLLLSAGIKDKHSSHEQFRLRVLNIFCLVCSCIPFVYIAMLWNTEFYRLNYVFIFFQALFFSSVLFNLIHKIKISRLILVLTTSTSVVVVSWITGFESGFHLYIYAAPLYVFLLFKLDEPIYIAISIFVYITCYVLIFVHKFHFTPLYNFDKNFLTHTLYPINLIMNFILLLFLFYSYTNFYFIMENNLLEKQEKLIEENGKRKASELHTQKLFNDLSMSYKNLEQFSFIVSHNLRAPLANIIGLSKLIEKEELTLDNKKIIGGIESAADILDNVLADLNYILQLKTQKIEAKSSINFEKSLHKIVSDLMSEHHISGLNIDTLYDKSIEIYTIKSLLEGILYQVIQNAIKFKKNDTELKISIALEQINDQTQISITDYGIGIDMASHQHKLFSLYGKINTDYPGKGLGLCIVKIYTELLNGAVRIESEPLQFTKVIITV